MESLSIVVDGFVKGLLALHRMELEIDEERLAIRIRGWRASNRRVWALLHRPLAYALSELADRGVHPAVSHRNFHVLTAVLMRPGAPEGRHAYWNWLRWWLHWWLPLDNELVILIGGNSSPYPGVQRRCAERGPAARGVWLGLVPFGAVTGGEPQDDDTTGVRWGDSGLLVTCCDCRAELPSDFGWSRRMRMWFFDLYHPDRGAGTTFGRVIDDHAEHDRQKPRKALMRVGGPVR